MTQQMDRAATVGAGPAASEPVRSRAPIHRAAIVLVVCTIALLAFILVQGDSRRRHRAVEGLRRQVATLVERVGESGILPLNLGPNTGPRQQARASRVEWLTRQEARLLRRSAGRKIVAHTIPVRQVLSREGRAVIFFENGRFDVEWLTLAEFDECYAAQLNEIRRQSGNTHGDPIDSP